MNVLLVSKHCHDIGTIIHLPFSIFLFLILKSRKYPKIFFCIIIISHFVQNDLPENHLSFILQGCERLEQNIAEFHQLQEASPGLGVFRFHNPPPPIFAQNFLTGLPANSQVTKMAKIRSLAPPPTVTYPPPPVTHHPTPSVFLT